jgi:hypothetical protein
MSNINDGGPAFPVENVHIWQGHGMSLRDYFAAKAMQGLVAQSMGTALLSPAEDAAAYAYAMANAMLKAREGKQ